MAKTRGSRADPVDYLNSLMSTPRFRLTFFILCAVLLAVLIWADESARSRGLESDFAPTQADLWFGIGLGAAVPVACLVMDGVVYVLWKWFRPRPWGEWSKWTQILVYISWYGWVFVLLLAPMVWCMFAKVFPLLPILAMGVALYLFLLTGWFKAEPKAPTES